MGSGRGPLLIVFAGAPGTGKTTLARVLARRNGAFYLSIDVIEQAMKVAGAERIGPAGYAVANAVAAANLAMGRSIVADNVNPVRASRLGWQHAAAHGAATLVDIHLICSDPAEHRRRVESRTADIPGLVLPTWDDVTERKIEPRDDKHLLLDTAAASPAELVARCEAYIEGAASRLQH